MFERSMLVLAIVGLIAFLDHPARGQRINDCDNFLKSEEDSASSHLDAELYEQSAREFEAILDQLSERQCPERYATMLMEAGWANYLQAAVDNQIPRLKKAIREFESAILFYSRKKEPTQWIGAKLSLSHAYHALAAIDDREKNSQIAASHLRDISQRRLLRDFLGEKGAVYLELALTHINLANWPEAVSFLEQAVHAWKQTVSETPHEVGGRLALARAFTLLGNMPHKSMYFDEAIATLDPLLQGDAGELDSAQLVEVNLALGNAYCCRYRLGSNWEDLFQSIDFALEAEKMASGEPRSSAFPFVEVCLAGLYVQLAEHQDPMGNAQLALQACEKALSTLSPTYYPRAYLEAKLYEGRAYLSASAAGASRSQIEDAIEAFDSALQISTPWDDPLTKGLINTELGQAYYRLSEIDRSESNCIKAVQHSRTALTFLPRERYPLERCTALNQLGYSSDYLGSFGDYEGTFNEAAQALNEVLDIQKEVQDSARIIAAQGNLVTTYATMGQRYCSAEPIVKALQVYGEMARPTSVESNPYDYGLYYHNLGLVYGLLADYTDRRVNIQNAIAAYSEALKAVPPQYFPADYVKTASLIADEYRNLAGLENRRTNLEKADSIYRELLSGPSLGLPDSKRTSLNIGRSSVLVELGSVTDSVETIEAALSMMRATLSEPEVKASSTRTVWILRQIAAAHVALAKLADTVSNCNQAIAVLDTALSLVKPGKTHMDSVRVLYQLAHSRIVLSHAENPEANLWKAISLLWEASSIREAKKDSCFRGYGDQLMGWAYLLLSKHGKPRENLDFAIDAYKRSLTKTNREDFPDAYYASLDGLGECYLDLAEIEDRDQNLSLAIPMFEEVLSVLPPELSPDIVKSSTTNLERAKKLREQ